MTRLRTKTLAATIRLSPEVRAAWEAAAAAERRSLASMFEVAMLEYVALHKISVAPAEGTSRASTSKNK
jgi:predicted transcriptional regulator